MGISPDTQKEEVMSSEGMLRFSRTVCAILVVSTLMVAAPAAAQYMNRFQGTFDGTEPTYVSPYCSTTPNAYTVVGPLTPTVTADYNFRDVGSDYDINVQVDLYSGSFDPASPATNYLLTFTDWNTNLSWLAPTLTAGTPYYFVVSQDCGGSPVGVWDFVLVGGEDFTSTGGTTMNGTFTGAEPIFDSPYCGDTNGYTVVGPFVPAVTGMHHYRDISINYDIDMQVDVYAGSFDPLSPLCGGSLPGAWEFVFIDEEPIAAPVVLAAIPTLGPWSIALLVFLLGVVGTAILRGFRF
jgi:hypothetical protein